MEVVTHNKPSTNGKRRLWILIVVISLIALAVGTWLWNSQGAAKNTKAPSTIQVVSATVSQGDISVRLTANGTVSALQTVDVRPQISATIRVVHIKEGQYVHKGDRLFTLDARTEDANLSKAEAQLVKDRADLKNAERNLERLRGLLNQEYISQAEFDTAQNLVDGLHGQLSVDLASVAASRVARSFNEITAPISGRSGSISVYPGSLVQPNSSILVSITQLDPINASFTLPEREVTGIQQAFSKSKVSVNAKLDSSEPTEIKGHLVFIDNTVDTSSGTIRLKSEFPNPGHRLWPGMFVTLTLAPQSLRDALIVPAQAVQTGPEMKFLYVIGEDHKATSVPVNVRLIQDGYAVVEGIASGTRVVVEGAQNLRPGSVVTESEKQGHNITDNPSKNRHQKSATTNSTDKQ
jgi:RND family efflux transporter MFP subunit